MCLVSLIILKILKEKKYNHRVRLYKNQIIRITPFSICTKPQNLRDIEVMSKARWVIWESIMTEKLRLAGVCGGEYAAGRIIKKEKVKIRKGVNL